MFFSTHTMNGDPDNLLAAKRAYMDPVVARFATLHRALATITIRTDNGIAVYNLWRDAEGARAFTEEPDVQQAQAASGLPAPSSFSRHLDAEAVLFKTS